MREFNDGTVRILQRLGLPVTRENYLMLVFAGHPPKEMDGEIQAEIDEMLETLSGGEWQDAPLPLTNRDRKLLRHMGIKVTE